MPDDPEYDVRETTEWWRRPLVMVREVKARVLSPDFSWKQTMLKVAPSFSLKLGSLFATPLRAAITSALLVAAPAAALAGAESAGAIDLVDSDGPAVQLTVLSEAEGLTIFTRPEASDVQRVTVFDQILDVLQTHANTVQVVQLQPTTLDLITSIASTTLAHQFLIETLVGDEQAHASADATFHVAILDALKVLGGTLPPGPPSFTPEDRAMLRDLWGAVIISAQEQ